MKIEDILTEDEFPANWEDIFPNDKKKSDKQISTGAAYNPKNVDAQVMGNYPDGIPRAVRSKWKQGRATDYEFDRAQREYDEYLQRKGEEETFGGDPSVMRDTVKIGKPERARGARGKNMTRADAEAQAAAKFKKPVDPKYPYTAPDGRRLKYPHGDLRNLFEPSPDTRKAGSDVVVRDSNKKKKSDSRMSDDDRK